MQNILQYLYETYHPYAIMVYGSYRNGTQDADSDFDALVLTDKFEKIHDESIVDGVTLDVWLYPCDVFQKSFVPNDFLQIYDGEIILDTTDSLIQAKETVIAYIQNFPCRSYDEIERELMWCEKMLRRVERGDAEGYFRHHWVLIDSLQVYCDIRGYFYFGPKKTLLRMKKEDSTAFALYKNAISSLDIKALQAWISYLKSIFS